MKRRAKKRSSGPGVYAFMRGTEWLYVGSTRELSRRPSKRDRNHESRWQAIIECDRCDLTPCESIIKAYQLEEQLIRTHHPKHNIRPPRSKANIGRPWQILRNIF